MKRKRERETTIMLHHNCGMAVHFISQTLLYTIPRWFFFLVISFHFNSIHVIVQFKVFLWHVDRWLVYLFEWIICFDFGSISLFQCEYFMWIATKKYLFQHRICSKRCRDMDVPSENGDSSRLFFKWKSVFSHSISMLLQFKLNGESV